jgi:hypothetical protein
MPGMNNVRTLILVLMAVILLPLDASAHCDGIKHTGDHPHCSDGGGDDGGGSEIATNDITARWGGPAVTGTLVTPRVCTLNGDPQPNGTHTAYGCVQEPVHTVSVLLTGGDVSTTKGSPTQEDADACTAGFAFVAYPNKQYVVAVGGEICTDADGCPLTIHNVFIDQPGMPANFVKLLAKGHVPQSTNLNPFACPDESEPVTQSYQISSIEAGISNSKGSKAELGCLFDVTGMATFEVTPVCP